MKDLPILFTGSNVRAILEGRKTQTRRVVKPQPDLHTTEWFPSSSDTGRWMGSGPSPATGGTRQTWGWAPCPYGQPGDRLWVRETWSSYLTMTRAERARSSAIYEKFLAGGYSNIVQASNDLPDPTGGPRYLYAADFDEETRADLKPWRPSIFMPRTASRILLEITDVRVQRVQDISEADAIAEGIERPASGIPICDARAWFHVLWNSINAKRGFGWAANPWVWVIQFRRIDAIDNQERLAA